MRTVRRLLYRDIVASVGFVALAFLALFFFIDFVDRLDDIGTRGRVALDAMLSAAWLLPGHLYELMPIAVLIGTIYSLARLAQTSEFTILRTGGLGPGRALGLLAGLGAAFALLTLVVGDYVTPFAERQGVLLEARLSGSLRIQGAGAWLKEKYRTPAGEGSVSINVAGTGADGVLQGVRIFEFDVDGRLVRQIEAATAVVDEHGVWRLDRARITQWPLNGTQGTPVVQVQQRAEFDWPSTLGPSVVTAAVLPLETMSTLELWRYSRHLDTQEQASQRYEIQFWKRALYPWACLVMVTLALPFAYLHARAGGISLKVFGGIMLGIGFVLLNNLAGHIGLLRDWTPWIVAAAPSLLFLLMSLAAFGWLVRYR